MTASLSLAASIPAGELDLEDGEGVQAHVAAATDVAQGSSMGIDGHAS